MMYEIAVRCSFHATHALRLYDGSLEPVHSHDWGVCVTVGSSGLDGIETVMDFHELERLVAGVIGVAEGKHLNDVEPFCGGAVNPSAERVAWWISRGVTVGLPDGVVLVSVSVTEAVGCVATYRPNA